MNRNSRFGSESRIGGVETQLASETQLVVVSGASVRWIAARNVGNVEWTNQKGSIVGSEVADYGNSGRTTENIGQTNWL